MTEKKAPLGLRVFRGVEANVLAHVLILAVNLVITPKLIGGLGKEGYAVFTLIWTLLNYSYVLILGTNLAVQKFTAEYKGRGEPGRLGRVLRPALLFNVAAGTVGLALLFAGRGWIAQNVLNTTSAVRDAAHFVLACAAIGCPFYFLTLFAYDVLMGSQRFRTAAVFWTFHSASIAVIAYALLTQGKGLREIGTAYVAVQAALAFGALFFARTEILGKGGELPDGDERAFVDFSKKAFVPQVLWLVTYHADKAFVAWFLPLAHLTYYQVASSLAQKFNVFCMSLSQIVFPIFTELHGTGQEERLRRFYLRSSQLFFYLILPVSVMTFILAPQFLTLWLDSEFSMRATWPVRLLVIGNLANMASMLPVKLSSGKGHPHLHGYLMAVKTPLLVALWAVAIPRWGITGAAAGFMIAEWLTTPPFIVYVHRRFLDLGELSFFLESCLRPALAALVLAGLGVATHAGVDSWLEFIVYGCAGMGLYYGLAYRLLDKDAKDVLTGFVRAKLGL